MEPRARVELATCRLRIGCSTTELPRRDLFTIALAIRFRNSGPGFRFVLANPDTRTTSGFVLAKPPQNDFPTRRLGITWAKNRTCSTGKRVHQPAQRYCDQYEHGEGPRSVFEALKWIAAAQRTERQRNDYCKKQKQLKVRQMQRHHAGHALRLRAASYACSAASRFKTPAVARKRVP